MNHEKFMTSALAMARRGCGLTGQNPSVGAVIVRKDEKGEIIIARAVTGPGGTPHAEPIALKKAGQAARGATLYVTLEPCNHQGRTPPCTDAILKAGIKEVIIASTDPDPRVKGGGIKRLESAGIAVTTGILKQQADQLNAGHFARQQKARPFITLKLAVSKDGRILEGGAQGNHKGPAWVTSERARAWGHLLRLEADAILVGALTARLDNPTLTCRLNGCEGNSPLPMVIDTNLNLPPSLQLFRHEAANLPVVFHAETATKEQISAYRSNRKLKPVAIPLNDQGRLSLSHLTQKLAECGITRLLVEGGPKLAKSFMAAGLVDEFWLFSGGFDIAHQGRLAFDDEPLEWALNQPGLKLINTLKVGDNKINQYRQSDESLATFRQ